MFDMKVLLVITIVVLLGKKLVDKINVTSCPFAVISKKLRHTFKVNETIGLKS